MNRTYLPNTFFITFSKSGDTQTTNGLSQTWEKWRKFVRRRKRKSVDLGPRIDAANQSTLIGRADPHEATEAATEAINAIEPLQRRNSSSPSESSMESVDQRRFNVSCKYNVFILDRSCHF